MARNACVLTCVLAKMKISKDAHNFKTNSIVKLRFIIPSPFAIEASHPGLMRQFELYICNHYPTYILLHRGYIAEGRSYKRMIENLVRQDAQPIALMSIVACLASGRLCLFT